MRVQPRWDFRSRAHPVSSSVSADPEESFAPRTLRRLSHRADGRLTDTRRRQRRGQVAPVAQIDEPTESGTSGAQRGRRRGPLSGRRYMQRPARQEQEDSAEGSGRGHVTSLANGAPPRDDFYPPSLDASTQLRFAASSPIIPFASRQYVNGAAALVYVVDASDEFQLGVSAASFHLLCTLPALRGKPVLLVWNKLDAPCPLPRVETTEAFELDRARAVLGEGGLTTMDVSALSGLNVEAVMMWMRGVYVSREHARGDA